MQPQGDGEAQCEAETCEDMHASVVVLASGVNLASRALGGAVPMEYSAGSLAHSEPAAQGQRGQSRIFVDTIGGVHCLQRPCGRSIVGGELSGYGDVAAAAREARCAREELRAGEAGETEGGAEQADGGAEAAVGEAVAVGGAEQAAARAAAAAALTEEGRSLLQRAAEWLPATAGRQQLEAVTRSVRVLPEDGMPAVGWASESGAYTCAAHSGFTLAPLLGALAAAELVEGVEGDLLSPWRPDRFRARA